ncbi:hypothetical protein ES703_85199 [subsurface metagenome]
MKAIKRNIVGLLRFIGLLFPLFLPAPRPSKPRIETPQKWDKYVGIIGPSEPLTVAETKFCPKCHQPVCQVRRTKQGVEIIQNGRVLVTVGSNIMISKNGKKETGFPIRCPNGHTVRIE